MDPQAAKAFILAKLRYELPESRAYHSLEHTLDVYASAIGIAESEGITGEGFTLLKVAALFHDSGFTEQDDDHENASCAIVRRVLPGMGFNTGQVDAVCSMILSTCIPQSPKNILEQILCDADLDYLGRNDFIPIGNRLFKEMRTYGILSTEMEWQKLQLKFLEQHRYFTRTNRTTREPVKQQHLEGVRQWLERHTGAK